MYNKLGLTLSGWKYARKEAGEADLGFLGEENTCKSSELMKPLREYVWTYYIYKDLGVSGVNKWERERGIRATWREECCISWENTTIKKATMLQNEQHMIKILGWIN